MTDRSASRSLLKWLVLPIGLAILAIGAVVPVAQRTSTTAYCTSCHEMQIYKTELEKSSHAVDKDKQPMGCAQCHIPHQVGLRYLTIKVLFGAKDLWTHYFGEPENLDRRVMQATARRFVPDENCLACHQDLTLDTKDQPLSIYGKLSHEAYEGKNGNTKRGCAGCHFNMAHLPDFDRRFEFNAQFAQHLPLLNQE